MQVYGSRNIIWHCPSLQSRPTPCDPLDGSPPGFPVPGILQARTLEWVAISFSNAWKWKLKVKLLSRVWLLETPWTAAHQAPLPMGFSRQEYWSWMPLPSPYLWDWNENWPFQSWGHFWVFQICWYFECCTLTASSFQIWNSSGGIPSPPLGLFVAMLPKPI